MLDLSTLSPETINQMKETDPDVLSSIIAFKLATDYSINGLIDTPFQLSLLSKLNELVLLPHDEIGEKHDFFSEMYLNIVIGFPMGADKRTTTFFKYYTEGLNEFPWVLELDRCVKPAIMNIVNLKRGQ